MQIIYCEPTEAEKDFYEALFKRSKVFLVFSKLILIYITNFHFTSLVLKKATLIMHVG